MKWPSTIKKEFTLLDTIQIVEIIFGDNFCKRLQFLPLPNNAVARRIVDNVYHLPLLQYLPILEV